MNKKILIMSLLAVFMLVSISFASSAEVNKDINKKESPLWSIRTGRAITEKINKIVENVKTRFLGERVFFLPLILQRFSQMSSLNPFNVEITEVGYGCPWTCPPATYCYMKGQLFCS